VAWVTVASALELRAVAGACALLLLLLLMLVVAVDEDALRLIGSLQDLHIDVSSRRPIVWRVPHEHTILVVSLRADGIRTILWLCSLLILRPVRYAGVGPAGSRSIGLLLLLLLLLAICCWVADSRLLLTALASRRFVFFTADAADEAGAISRC
jgi:hypothetical protein